MKTLRCDEVHALLGARADGELAAAERRAVDAHLAACPGCARRLEILRALGRAVRGAGAPAAAPETAARLAGLPARVRSPRAGRRWPLAAGLAAAAALALVLVRAPAPDGHATGDLAGLNAGAADLPGARCGLEPGHALADLKILPEVRGEVPPWGAPDER